MKQFQIRLAIYSALVCLLLSLNAAAQDFRKSYEIGQGGSISVRNVSGDVTVTGYEGETVLVLGFKEGRDRDRVWVEDNSAGNNVDVRARYPDNCDCNASIRFEVKVPRANYKFDPISSTSGNVEVEIMQLSGAGDMEFASTSGNVRVKLPANLDADVRMSTTSGGLKTDFPLTIEEPERGSGRRAAGRVGGGSRNLRLSSTSGSVSLLMM